MVHSEHTVQRLIHLIYLIVEHRCTIYDESACSCCQKHEKIGRQKYFMKGYTYEGRVIANLIHK